jgi:hypothetical protein
MQCQLSEKNGVNSDFGRLFYDRRIKETDMCMVQTEMTNGIYLIYLNQLIILLQELQLEQNLKNEYSNKGWRRRENWSCQLFNVDRSM